MFGLPKHTPKIGFRRILTFCDEEQIDIEAIGKSSIVVTGSNGKGSTSRFAYACLQTAMDRVGCFTSPHLWELNERFEISGQRIDDASLREYIRRILEFNEKLRHHDDCLGAFELLFLVALLWFKDRSVQCAVWEAGIGGRYDPVRVLRCPMSALASVDLEHTDILGTTRQLIAYDKLDAVRALGHTFISPAVDASMTGDLEAYAAVTGQTLTFVTRAAAIADISSDAAGVRYTMSVPGHTQRVQAVIPLLGVHQVHNSATAVHVVNAYLNTNWDLSDGVDAMADVQWTGRLERISDHPETWVDVGHTPEAVEVVSRTLESMLPAAQWLIVFGVSANKRVRDISEIIRLRFPNVILTQTYKGGCDASLLASEYFEPSTVIGVTHTIEEAVALSRSVALERGLKIAVIGGLFLSVEFTHALRGNDPKSLEFF